MDLEPMTTTDLRDLEAARRDFPRYHIEVEPAIDRRRYIARRAQPGPGPHTLITSDLTELRAELATSRPPRRSRAGGHPVTDPTARRRLPWTTVPHGRQRRLLRRQNGLSRAKLATRAGIGAATVARLERQDHTLPQPHPRVTRRRRAGPGTGRAGGAIRAVSVTPAGQAGVVAAQAAGR